MFQRFADSIGGGPGSYAIIFGLAALDVVFPLLPSETAVITAGTLAAEGTLILALVIPVAALGAFVGDNISYFLGRLVGEPVSERLFRGEKGQKRLDWAQNLLDRHGGIVIITARFFPGGRTAATFAAGALEFPYRRFVIFDAIAAIFWASFASLLGYVGGHAFEEEPWKGLLLAFGIGMGLIVVLEGYRRFQERRGRDILGGPDRPG